MVARAVRGLRARVLAPLLARRLPRARLRGGAARAHAPRAGRLRAGRVGAGRGCPTSPRRHAQDAGRAHQARRRAQDRRHPHPKELRGAAQGGAVLRRGVRQRAELRAGGRAQVKPHIVPLSVTTPYCSRGRGRRLIRTPFE